ncbi:hypothetical protein EJ06DRAFT_402743 [Trichodelitschia bisporula]|uniref:Uncharacterized protein n=1 Tax=Trichodelitschia bisporula TaxID=703511 RepID=A0A6G1HXY2_9PEZI|nr:hypothetical protein EJ06DRAFT_402743 [Trichodelitschia bisporula]
MEPLLRDANPQTLSHDDSTPDLQTTYLISDPTLIALCARAIPLPRNEQHHTPSFKSSEPLTLAAGRHPNQSTSAHPSQPPHKPVPPQILPHRTRPTQRHEQHIAPRSRFA